MEYFRSSPKESPVCDNKKVKFKHMHPFELGSEMLVLCTSVCKEISLTTAYSVAMRQQIFTNQLSQVFLILIDFVFPLPTL